MTPRTLIKVTLVLGGLGIFGVGIRLGNESLRWTGIALVGVAWMLRFWKTPPDTPTS